MGIQSKKKRKDSNSAGVQEKVGLQFQNTLLGDKGNIVRNGCIPTQLVCKRGLDYHLLGNSRLEA